MAWWIMSLRGLNYVQHCAAMYVQYVGEWIDRRWPLAVRGLPRPRMLRHVGPVKFISRVFGYSTGANSRHAAPPRVQASRYYWCVICFDLTPS